MKKNLFFFLLSTTSFLLNAQTEGSAFNLTGGSGLATVFSTDYQAIGVNPANIPCDTSHHIALGIGEAGFSFFSNALLKDEVRDVIFNNKDSLSDEQQMDFGQAFVENGVTFHADVRVIGLSFKLGKNAGLALSFDGRSSYYSKLGEKASEFIFNGYDFTTLVDTVIISPVDSFGVIDPPINLSEILNGTSFRFNVRSDINLAFGTQLFALDNIQVFGGVGLKYILGFAYLDLETTENTVTGVSALGLGLFDLTASDTPSEIILETFKPVGTGFGVDVGTHINIGEKISLAVSVVDIGKMKYTANVLQLEDAEIDTIFFTGVTTTDPIELLTEVLQDENVISYSGATDFEVNLPTTLRLGAGVQVTDFLKAGIDVVAPFNDVAGAYENALLGVGAELTAAKFLKLSAGTTIGGGYDFNLSAGIALDFDFWEIGIASRDIITLFGQASPTVSMAVGVLRFKI
ncbi:MAG: DUF5723 family protein [Chitinophagales bacterium]